MIFAFLFNFAYLFSYLIFLKLILIPFIFVELCMNRILWKPILLIDMISHVMKLKRFAKDLHFFNV